MPKMGYLKTAHGNERVFRSAQLRTLFLRPSILSTRQMPFSGFPHLKSWSYLGFKQSLILAQAGSGIPLPLLSLDQETLVSI